MWVNQQIVLLLLGSVEENGDELRESTEHNFTSHMAFSYKWGLQNIDQGVDFHAFW